MRYGVLHAMLLAFALGTLPAAGQEAQADEKEADAEKAAPKRIDKADEKAVAGKQQEQKADVVEVKPGAEEGEKSYKFGEVEVEGRLKAPQILYFLRRVRAEFRAGLLGHRSFLPELSDTRRSPALR
jgi:hypothetical protein